MMAVDPEIRREKNRINKQNQRARDRAAAEWGLSKRASTRYINDYTVAKAFDDKYNARKLRIAAIESLPSVNSPTKNIEVDRGQESALAGTTKFGAKRQAEALRESARNQKLEVVGSGRRKSLLAEAETSENSARYNALSDSQKTEFIAINKRFARGSNQSLALFFEYQGGAEAYNAIVSDLIYPSSEAIDEALTTLSNLADLADKARAMYAPKKIGRLGV